MRKFLSLIGYVCLGLPLTFSLLLMTSLRPWALDRDFYKRTLTDDKLYAALQDPALAKAVDPVLDLDGVKVDGPVFIGALQKRLPVPELKSVATNAVDETFDWLENKPGAESARLDLKPLKKSLEQSKVDLLRDYAQGIPSKPEKPAKGDLTFRPSTVSAPVFAAAADKALGEAIAVKMPDTVPFPGSGEKPPLLMDGSGRVTNAADSLKNGTIGLGVFTSLVLAGLSFLGGRRAVDRLRIAGNYLIIPSALVLGMGAFAYFGLGPAAGAIVASLPADAQLVNAPAGGLALFTWFGGVGREIAKYFFISGLVGTCAGGLFKSLRRAVDPERIE